jgi:hypothetical protein
MASFPTTVVLPVTAGPDDELDARVVERRRRWPSAAISTVPSGRSARFEEDRVVAERALDRVERFGRRATAKALRRHRGVTTPSARTRTAAAISGRREHGEAGRYRSRKRRSHGRSVAPQRRTGVAPSVAKRSIQPPRRVTSRCAVGRIDDERGAVVGALHGVDEGPLERRGKRHEGQRTVRSRRASA